MKHFGQVTALLTLLLFSAAAAYSQSPTLNDTALFLAGKKLSADSPLKKETSKKYYRQYQREITAGWSNFQEKNLASMKTWWKSHGINHVEKNILYPFSGPDVMNVLMFYPDGDSYTLFGLEKPGLIPDTRGMNGTEIRQGLNGVRRSLNTILNVNFFRTKGMAKKLGNESFNGIAGLVMIFLSKLDYTIVDARHIAIDSSSNLVDGTKSDLKINWENPPASKRIPGVEITFRKGNGKKQTIRYFNLNVIDYALKTQSPNFLPYIQKNAPYSTFLKSASYLMHNDDIKFTKIRAAILKSSNSIVQDDSGVPLRYFPAKKWNVAFHGIYEQPIALFKHRYQSDLRAAMKKNTSGVLPFSYGYNYQKGKSNLMIITRKGPQ
jgi:hypothetical protein